MPYDSAHTSAPHAPRRRGGAQAAAAAPDGLAAMLDGFSLEITPGVAGKVASFADLLPAGTAVYVTNLPGTEVRAAMAVCRRLRDDGLRPVPHLAARGLKSRAALADWLARAVGDGGAREIMLIAGSAERPAGPFRDTFDVLETGLIGEAGLSGLGVAGHPEGHPNAGAAVLLEALRRKQAFAEAQGLSAWIVTQFVFSAAPLLRWASMLAEAGITLPIRAGLPGPAKPATLITYARQCGVGNSLRVLTRRPDVMAGLLRSWTPDGIVADLARTAPRQGPGAVAGVHLFPFGGFVKTAGWATASLEAARTGAGAGAIPDPTSTAPAAPAASV